MSISQSFSGTHRSSSGHRSRSFGGGNGDIIGGNPIENIIDTDSRLKWIDNRLSASFRTPQMILGNVSNRNPNLVDTKRVFEDDEVRRDVTAFLDSDTVSVLYAFTVSGDTATANTAASPKGGNNNNHHLNPIAAAHAASVAFGNNNNGGGGGAGGTPLSLILTAAPSTTDLMKRGVKKILVIRKNLGVGNITVDGIQKELSVMETHPAMLRVTNQMIRDVFRPLVASQGVDRNRLLMLQQQEIERERAAKEEERKKRREAREAAQKKDFDSDDGTDDDESTVAARKKKKLAEDEKALAITNGEQSPSAPVTVDQQREAKELEERPRTGAASKPVRKHLLSELTKIANVAIITQGQQDGMTALPLPMQQHRDQSVNVGTPAQQNAREVERLAMLWISQFKDLLDKACPNPEPPAVMVLGKVRRITEARSKAMLKHAGNSHDGDAHPLAGGGNQEEATSSPPTASEAGVDDVATASSTNNRQQQQSSSSVLRDDGSIAPPLIDLSDIPPNIMPLGIIYPLEEARHWHLHAANTRQLVTTIIRSEVFKRCVMILKENRSEFTEAVESYVEQLEQHLLFVESTNKWLAPLIPYFQLLAPRSGRTTLSFGTTAANAGAANHISGVTTTTTAIELTILMKKSAAMAPSLSTANGSSADSASSHPPPLPSMQQFPIDQLIKTNYISEVFELLYLLWEHNDAFPSTARTASMMVGIAEYIIVACVEHLDLEQSFLTGPTKETLCKLQEVFAVCAKVKSAVMWFKQKATAVGRGSIVSSRVESETEALQKQQNKKNNNTNSITAAIISGGGADAHNNTPITSGTKVWDVSHIQILAHMDQFLERCNDLVQILETRELYAWLTSYDLTGVEGNALHDTIVKYVKQFEDELRVGYVDEGAFDALPHPCSKFDSLTRNHLLAFTRELETKIAEGIAQYVSSAPMGIALTRHVFYLQRILERPSAQNQQVFIISELVKRWCEEMKTVKMILKEATVPVGFTAFSDTFNSASPNDHKNSSPFVGGNATMTSISSNNKAPTRIVLGVTQAQTTIFALSLCRRLYDLALVMGDLLALPRVRALPGQEGSHKAALLLRDDIDDRVSAAFEDSFVLWANGLPAILSHLSSNLLRQSSTVSSGGAGGRDFEVSLDSEVTMAIREVSILNTILAQPQVRSLFPNIQMPSEALYLLEIKDRLWTNHTALLNNVEAFNGIRKSIVPHEKLLLANEIEAVTKMFMKGTATPYGNNNSFSSPSASPLSSLSQQNYNSLVWESKNKDIVRFNENCAAAVKTLELALKSLRSHIDGLSDLLKALTTSEDFHFLPLRNSHVGDKTLPLCDLQIKYAQTHSKRQEAFKLIKDYLSTLSQNALQTLNATQCPSTAIHAPSSSADATATHGTGAAANGGGGHASVSFAPTSARRTPLTEDHPDWRAFIAYVDGLVSKEVRDFLSHCLQTLRRQLDPQWLRENDGLPLLQSQLVLDEREGIRVTPDLHTETHLSILRMKEDPFTLVIDIMPTKARQDALNSAISRDIMISKREVMISRALEDTWRTINAQVGALSKFEELYSPNMKKDIVKRLNSGNAPVYNVTLEEIVEQLAHYRQLSRKIGEITNIRIIVGWLRLDYRAAKEALHRNAKECMQLFVSHVHTSILNALEHVRNFSQRATNVFDTDLNNMDTDDSKLVKKVFQLIRDVKSEDAKIKAIFQPLLHGLRLLHGWMAISKEEHEQLYEEMGLREPEWTATVNKSVGVREQLAGVYEREVESLRVKVKDFERRIGEERGDLLSQPIFSSSTHLDDPYADLVVARKHWVDEIKIISDELIAEQELFEVDFSTLETVTTMISDIHSCKQFWDGAFLAAKHSEEWLMKPFIHVDTTLLVDETRKISRFFALSLPRETRHWKAFAAAERRLNRIISSIPLIQDLRTGALRRRHWDQLLDLCESSGMGMTTGVTSQHDQDTAVPSSSAPQKKKSFKKNPSAANASNKSSRIDPMGPSTTLGALLNLNLHHHSDMVTKLVERAEKELQIENILDRIDTFWAKVKLPTTPCGHLSSAKAKKKNTNASENNATDVHQHNHIMGPTDALRETLEEHINLVQSTQASRWGEFFKQRSRLLFSHLQLVDCVLTIWGEGQKVWDALYPIFVESEDMRRALPQDVKAFDTVTVLFRQLCQVMLHVAPQNHYHRRASDDSDDACSSHPPLFSILTAAKLTPITSDQFEALHLEKDFLKALVKKQKQRLQRLSDDGGDDDDLDQLDETVANSGAAASLDASVDFSSGNGSHSQPNTVEYQLEIVTEVLQRCNASLATYLEAKRRIFPRFFFVSDADLITIFAKAEFPPIVCGFVGKLCDAVEKCVFAPLGSTSSQNNAASGKQRNNGGFDRPPEKLFVFGEEPAHSSSSDDENAEDDPSLRRNTITAVISIEGEHLPLPIPFICQGAVEVWLNNLIEAIRDAVRAAVIMANAQYIETPRPQWMFEHITQAVCLVARAQWTAQSTTALEAVEDGNLSALSDHASGLKQQLVRTIETVSMDLSPLKRKSLFTLITIDVHARDIIFDLIAKRIDSTTSFSWQKVLRFYFENPQAHVSLSSPLRLNQQHHNHNPNGTVNGNPLTNASFNNTSSMVMGGTASEEDVREVINTIHGMSGLASGQICDTNFNHGFEYIGNCGCLVVTPLTDRCYITLTQALKLHKGGAPAGPAGTGKTETVKDIARTLGYPVYVFNCSEQMDYLSVGNIFKGLAMSGAWGCFDEFNRIAIEVLSVVAAQVKSILDACASRADHFSILGAQLQLNPSVGIFVTMNPGYKGRTELPENVKALFRPCAMVVPDLENICEIYLSAEGFILSRELSKKFVRLYQLNKELLSPQDHYDWGLRAIRAVLAVAGKMKRSFGMTSSSSSSASAADLERSIFLSALRESNMAKLIKSDVVMFGRLLASLFPNIHDVKIRDTTTEIAVKNATQSLGYSLGENNIVVTKITQFFELLNVRHSVFVLGPAGSGKSALLSIAGKALENKMAMLLPSSSNSKKNDGTSPPFVPSVVVESFDPKAITSFELYGYVAPQTREWRDGILSRTFRDFATNPIYRREEEQQGENSDQQQAPSGGAIGSRQTSVAVAPHPPSAARLSIGISGGARRPSLAVNAKNTAASPSTSSAASSQQLTAYGLANGGGAQWIVLDGAIDADWIESMNSVMDDNKLLTLANNERIPMTSSMRLIFEITNLQNATPATVSRAGILHVGETDLGWVPMKDRWLFGGTNNTPTTSAASVGNGKKSIAAGLMQSKNGAAANNNAAAVIASSAPLFVNGQRVGGNIPESLRTTIDILFDRHVDNFINFVTGATGTTIKNIVPLSNVQYVRSLCDLLEALLSPKTSPFNLAGSGNGGDENNNGNGSNSIMGATRRNGGGGVGGKTVTITEPGTSSSSTANSPSAATNNNSSNFTERVFLWACIWVFGSPIAYPQSIIDYRTTFSSYVRREYGGVLGLPDDDSTVFDWCLVPQNYFGGAAQSSKSGQDQQSKKSNGKKNAASSASDSNANSGGFVWQRWFDASITYNVLLRKTALSGATVDEMDAYNAGGSGANTPPMSPVYHGNASASLEPTDISSLLYNFGSAIAPSSAICPDVKYSTITNFNIMFQFDPSTPLSEIILPNEDTERHSYFTNLLARAGKHVLLVGNAGSGKSALVKYLTARAREAAAISDELLATATNPTDIAAAQQMAQHVSKMQYLSYDDYQFSTLHLDGQSDSFSVQKRMEEKLEKRVGKQFGPVSRKKLIVVVENLNLPMPDKYGSQSALAVLRQHMDKGFWYDRVKLVQKEIIDQQYIATMNPNIGTQNNIPDRLLGKFVSIGVGIPTEKTMVSTFSALLKMCLQTRGVSDALSTTLADTVPAIAELWAAIVKRFLPTANAFHYSFTLRDISRVTQGLTVLDSKVSNGKLMDSVAMVWLHQLRSVFCDRLSNLRDYNEALQMCVSKSRQLFSGVTSSSISPSAAGGNGAIGCDLSGSAIPLVPFETLAEEADGSYAPIPRFGTPTMDCADALEFINRRREMLMEGGNGGGKSSDANLIFFDQAVENIIRVARVITQPAGNAFIIGYSGSGKKGLAKMASRLCLFELFPLKSNGTLGEFSSDVSRAVMRCVMKQERLVFLLSTNDGYSNEMLSVIDEYLSGQHFDSVLDVDAKTEIMTRMTNELRLGGGGGGSSAVGGGESASSGSRSPQDPFLCRQRYISKLVNNLRVIITTNSNVDTLRYYMRRFPSFQTCMQMIYFHEWPEEALIKVADSALGGGEINTPSENDTPVTTRHAKNIKTSGSKNKTKRIDFSVAVDDLIRRKPPPILGDTPPGSPTKAPPSHTSKSTTPVIVPAPSPKVTGDTSDDVETTAPAALKKAICHHLAKIHLLASDMCIRVAKQYKKVVYVTPKTFLTAVEVTENLIIKKRNDFERRKTRLEVGLEQLQRCGEATNTLRAELKIVKLQVEEQAVKTNALLERVEVDRGIVEQQNQLAAKEQERTVQINIEVNELVAECEADLLAAQPMIQAALAALKTLNKSNLTELKSMGSPPPDVAEVTACVMCLLAKPTHIPRDRSWAASRRMMQDVPRWMTAMESLDFNNIPQECIDAIWKTVHMPHFDDELIKSKSFAASSLCRWVKKVVEYHKVRLVVRPKEDRLASAEARLVISKTALAKVQKKVALLKAKLDEIEAQYAAALATKQQLEEQLLTTEQKMQRAQRLLVSLGSEKGRWEQSLQFLDADRGVIDGDALIAASFVVYAGPLLSEVRGEFMSAVKSILSENPFYAISYTKRVRKPFVAPPPPPPAEATSDAANEKTAEGPSDSPASPEANASTDGTAPVETETSPPAAAAPETNPVEEEDDKNKYSGELDPINTLFSAVDMAKWVSEGLPDTKRMTENAAVALSHKLWPLLVDPENQALRWVQGRALGRKLTVMDSVKANSEDSDIPILSEKDVGSSELVVLRQGDKNYITSLLKAAAVGAVTLIEDVNAENGIDAMLQPLLDKQYNRIKKKKMNQRSPTHNDDDDSDSPSDSDDHEATSLLTCKKSSDKCCNVLTLNDKQVVVHPAFSLFLRTSISSPKFQPEVFSRAAVIDFSVTEQGLQELLLSMVVVKEKPDLEEKRVALANTTNKMIISLLQCEDILLEQLSNADGDILQNEKLVRTLESAKTQSVEMVHALKEADKTRILLKSALNLYAPIAARGALIYMCLMELSKVDEMYRYAIKSFSDQFVRSITKAQLLCATMLVGGGGGSGGGNNNKKQSNSSNAKTEEEDEAAIISQQEQQRIDVLVLGVTKGIYAYVSRSLFTRHRIVLAAALTFAVGLRNNTIPENYLNFLIRCPTKVTPPMPSIVKDWLTEQQWQSMHSLSDITTKVFYASDEDDTDNIEKKSAAVTPAGSAAVTTSTAGVTSSDGPIVPFSQLIDECLDTMRWRVWCDHPTPENERLPGDWKQLSAFEKLMLIRVMRNDRMISATRNFIIETMGKYLFEDYEVPLADVVTETPNFSPILFILSPGADPSRAVSVAASKHGISELGGQLITISMGQGQEQGAEKAIQTAISEGQWILLHNVHLMRTWIKKLDRIVSSSLTEKDPTTAPIHPKFRLFMSADPIDYFPTSLLQSSTKLVDEPPAGLKANFTRAYALYAHEPWENSTKPQEYHALVYTLCFFHAIVVERSKFGPSGWNRKYPFNFEDLIACTDVLAGYLEERPRVPWEDLQYVFGQIMYGGHITDQRDSTLCMTYLQRLVSSELIDGPPGTEIVLGSGVPLPLTRSHTETMAMINEVVHDEGPRMFSMNPLSENRARSADASQMFQFLFDVLPKKQQQTKKKSSAQHDGQGDGEKNKSAMEDDLLLLSQADMIAMMLGAVPEQLPTGDIIDRLGSNHDMTPSQHVFYQECERLNRLSATMRSMLDEADNALRGTVTMTNAIEQLLTDLQNDVVPLRWLALWGETKRPLGAWAMLVADANTQLSSWAMDFMTPKAVNLQCFFIPIAFLTAIQQETALRLNTELDQMGLIVEVTKKQPSQIDLHARDGCFVYGPSLEGAVWDTTANCLSEVTNKDGTPMPVMIIKAGHLSKIDRSDCYACPLYATTARFSTYITTLYLKTRSPQSEWVLRGTALILDGAH